MPNASSEPTEAADHPRPGLSGPSVLGLSRGPLLPPPQAPEVLWPIALGELKQQMTKATFNAWLVDSRVIPEVSNLAFLVVAVRNQYAYEWLTHRLRPVIVRTLAGVAGHEVGVCFIPRTLSMMMRSDDESPRRPATRLCFDDADTGLFRLEDEPEMVSNLNRNAYLEQLLTPAGVAPTHPGDIPVNIAPELFMTLSTEGDHPMSNQTLPSPTRVRIYSHITQSRFLHVEDALGLGTGKIRLFAGQYHRGQGMSAHSQFYMDLADARVIFEALARGEQRFSHKAYKGTPPQNGRTAISRVLSITVKGENVYIELKTGPGKLTNTGAIAPNGKPEVEINVAFKLYEARRLAASVLAYIQAWDVMRMMVNQQLASRPTPYLLVAAMNETGGVQSEQAEAENGKRKSPVVATNVRPVTRKDPVPKTTSAKVTTAVKRAARQPDKPDTGGTEPAGEAVTSVTSGTGLDTQPLRYGNGSLVDTTNLIEVQTFQQYRAEKKAAPESKVVLLNYYRLTITQIKIAP